MQVLPYLCFEGRCQEAIEFYTSALGAEVVMVMYARDAPPEAQGCAPVSNPQHVMHAVLKVGDNELLMSDGMGSGKAEFSGITLSVSVPSDEQVTEKFRAIAQGGEVKMDLAKAFFASLWGVCTDKFGVNWMVLSPVPVHA